MRDHSDFVTLKKHFQRTRTEKSTPAELAEYAGNNELKAWLIELENKLSRNYEHC